MVTVWLWSARLLVREPGPQKTISVATLNRTKFPWCQIEAQGVVFILNLFPAAKVELNEENEVFYQVVAGDKFETSNQVLYSQS